MYVNKGSKAAFWTGWVWFWPHTWWGSLASGQHHGWSPRLSREAVAKVGEVQTHGHLQPLISGAEHGAQRSLIFPPQPWVKASTCSAITTPLVNRECFFTWCHYLEGGGAKAERTCCDVNPILQHSSLGARRSTRPSQIPILPSNYTAPSCRRKGSEECLLIFVIKSKHHVLVKNKTVSVFKILPSTWHLCLSMKCFAVIARLQARHLFLIMDLNDCIEMKYMQV